MTLILANATGSDVAIQDLGISLQPSEDLDLVLNFNDEEIIESTSLEASMVSDVTVHLDGTTLLTYTDLIDLLTKLVRYDIIDGNKLYIYDRTRLKILSTTSICFGFGSVGVADGKFLEGISGYSISRNGTIISVSASVSSGFQTKAFEVIVNSTTLKTFNLIAGSYISTNDDIDVNAGDIIKVYVSSIDAFVRDPSVTVELSWRI